MFGLVSFQSSGGTSEELTHDEVPAVLELVIFFFVSSHILSVKVGRFFIRSPTELEKFSG